MAAEALALTDIQSGRTMFRAAHVDNQFGSVGKALFGLHRRKAWKQLDGLSQRKRDRLLIWQKEYACCANVYASKSSSVIFILLRMFVCFAIGDFERACRRLRDRNADRGISEPLGEESLIPPHSEEQHCSIGRREGKGMPNEK